MRLGLGFAVAGLLATLVGTAVAQEMKLVGPFRITPEAGIISIDHPIGLNDAEIFAANFGTVRGPVTVLVGDDGGGDIGGALLVAEEIHSRDIVTAIRFYAVCDAACALMALAGRLSGVDDSLMVIAPQPGWPLPAIEEALVRFGAPEPILAAFSAPVGTTTTFDGHTLEVMLGLLAP